MILCMSVVSFVTYLFSFLISLAWVLFLFFLMNLAEILSVLFIFSNNQLLISLIFAIVFFVSISFMSPLLFMISLHLLTLGFVYHFSLVVLGTMLGCLFEFFLLFYDPKSMDCRKSSSQREVYSDTILPWETRISNNIKTLHLKQLEKEQSPKLLEGKKS